MPPRRNRTAAEWKAVATAEYKLGEELLERGENLNAAEAFARAQAAASIGLLTRAK